MTQPCYPSVAVITVVSVLHRKQFLLSRQSVRLAFPWVKIPSIFTHINHDSQSLPENWLLCLKCVSPDFSGFLSMAPCLPKAQLPLAFSGTTYLFKDYLNDVPCVTQGQRDKDNPAFWGGTVLPIPVLSCCNLRFPSVCAQRGWTLAGTKITVCKCTLKAALVFQRLFFCSMLCTIASSSATLQALSREWKNCHPSHPPPKKGHSRISGHKKKNIFHP